MRTHEISIIVTATSGSSSPKDLLEGLCAQSLQAREILIVRPPVGSGWEQILEAYDQRLPLRGFSYPKRGAAVALNRAIAAASGDILVFIDADCVPHEGWIEAINRSFARQQDLQVLHGPVSGEGLVQASPDSFIDPRNVAVRKEVIERFRMPFDERSRFVADMELFWKLRQVGVQVHFCDEMRVDVRPSGGWRSYYSNWRQRGISKGLNKRLHDDFWDPDLVQMNGITTALSAIGREMRSRRHGRQWLHFVRRGALADALSYYPAVLVQRWALTSGLLRAQRLQIPDCDRFLTPPELILFVTNRCELRCKHCFYHDGLRAPVQQMSARQVGRLLDSMNRDLRTVAIVGGEPFLCDELVEICAALSSRIHVKDVFLFTNGYHTSRIVEMAGEIAGQARFNLFLRVSLDGLRHTHDRIRQNRRAFDNAVQTIARLTDLAQKERRLGVEAQTTIMRSNFDELEALAEFVSRELHVFLTFDITRDSSTAPQIPGFSCQSYGPMGSEELLSPGQLQLVGERVRQIYDRYFSDTRFNPFQIAYQRSAMDLGCRQLLERRPLLRCNAGDGIVTVYPNYDVAICDMTSPIGNLADFDFDLGRLLRARLTAAMKASRQRCYCTNPCNIFASIRERSVVAFTTPP